jgi:hypothetical protein
MQSGHGGVYDPVHDGIFYSGSLDEGESFSFQFGKPGPQVLLLYNHNNFSKHEPKDIDDGQ